MLLWVHSQSHWLLSVVLFAADKDTINWLRHNSRSYIFSASNTPAATAAARAALHILKSEPERRENLWKITNYALDCFRQAGFEIGDTESPIIPLYVRDTDKTFEVTNWHLTRVYLLILLFHRLVHHKILWCVLL